MSDVRLPPVLSSEVSAELLALEPRLREMFNRDEVTMTGDELERLLGGIFLFGYGRGIEERQGDTENIARAAEASGLV